MMSNHSKGSYLVIPSRRGSVPDLTPTQVRNILQPEERLISISVVEACLFEMPCSRSNMALSSFCGLPDFKVVLTCKSAFCGLHASGPTTSQSIVGEHENGRITIDVAKWSKLVRILQPSFAVPIHDAVSLLDMSHKRRKLAYTRSELWYKQSVNSITDNSCTLLAPASLNLPVQTTYVDLVPQNENVRAFHEALVLITQNSLSAADCEYDDYTDHANRNVKENDVPFVMCIASNIATICAAIDADVHLIESTLPWALAEKGIAFTVNLDYTYSMQDNVGVCVNEPQIDLNDSSYALDIAPLCTHCVCFTCMRHHRAYLHHLLTVQEMNATILLAIHNLAWLAELLRRCRRCSDRNERTGLLRHILSQC